jgi:uncharacterized protein YegP (UPF0339 family)
MSEHEVRPHHVEVFEGEDEDFYWRRVGANGEEVSRSSEGYSTQSNANRAAHSSNPDLFGRHPQVGE